MLDLFTIFSKGGIVLWYFQGTSQLFTASVNELIKNVILQERGVSSAWNHNTLSLQYKLDNEFELVFVVAYQNILKLTYIDKFLNEIQLRFRDMYKNQIQNSQFSHDFSGFNAEFHSVLKECEAEAKAALQTTKKPMAFSESAKSTKTVSSMLEKKTGFLGSFMSTEAVKEPATGRKGPAKVEAAFDSGEDAVLSNMSDDQMSMMNESKMKKLIAGGQRPKKFEKKGKEKEKVTPTSPKAKGKVGTKWDADGHQGPLDYGSKDNSSPDNEALNTDLDKYASVSVIKYWVECQS
jgi:signal recognition particle receptor subunit alpha